MCVQYTIEHESTSKMLPFLDVSITNNGSGKYEFAVYRKPAITNVMIKPTSAIDPKIAPGVFKGFLARAFRICSENQLQDEINFLCDVFVENGYERTMLDRIVSDYSNNNNRRRRHQSITSSNDPRFKNMVKLPWIPMVGPKLRRIYRRYGFKVVFTSLPNLANILCKNKCAFPKNSEAGVYKIDCNCGQFYVGETKKRVKTRVNEHKKAAEKSNWKFSGLSEHCKECTAGVRWSEASTICQENEWWHRKVREGLEISKLNPTLNRDQGMHVSDSWKCLL